MTIEAVLELVDSAPVFAASKPLTLEERRQIGSAELGRLLGELIAAPGLDALQAIAEQLGQLVAADAIVETFAKASLEQTTAGAGMIGEHGAKPVKAAIAAGLKAGKKRPRDLGAARAVSPIEVRRAASAALGAPHDDGRAPVARDDVTSPPPEEAVLSSSAASLPPPPPAPPDEGNEDATSQMGDWSEAAASLGSGGGDGEVPEDADARNMRLAFFPLTDLGNAERFRERQRGRLLFNTALATTSPGRQRGWLAWDAKRWSSESGAERVMIAEHDTVRAIQDEADCVAESGDRDADGAERGARDFVVETKNDVPIYYSDKIARWGRTSESAQKLGALSKRGAPYLSVGIGQLDADKMKINVNNGTLTIRRRDDADYVQFGPHNPSDMITKLAPVDYDPSAAAPEFEKFLLRVQPNPEMRLFLQQWFGLSLTGDTSAHKLAFLYGKGRNGKSVLVNAVSHVAGDYAQSVPIETFLDQGKVRAGGQATPDLAKLPGIRLLRTSEPEKNAKLAEALIKLVTGGEPMDARHLQGDFFTFFPEFKLTIQGNYKPVLSGTDEGIKSRLLLVPFSVTIPKEERDTKLVDKLKAEASGILNWMLDGLRSWLDNGLTEPQEVTEATAKYFATSDVLGRFLESCTVKEPGHRVQSSVLHQVYEAWCKSSGETPWKNRGFSLAMDERGYERKQSDVVWWLDIKLIKSVNDFVDANGNPIRVSSSDDDDRNAGDVEI
ncbi:putative DNA primase/helicase [Bradyrhizobium brasilense]|uniref:Putative DNA primase/helicase n=1 Tax=Bradyrhizobium brasilense TaxID=1419277 RepID=A0A1G6ILD9_9BRAD|nr:phage/plasmid primase, P4 family [Bradyrhizobium brasilense]SDC07284.1 putative DNA primase/helicase [Bradyrhizobium brasilense]